MSGKTGPKLTDISITYCNPRKPDQYRFEDGKWWYYYPDGSRPNAGNRESVQCLIRKRNKKKQRLLTEMWVDGEQISPTHPLFKPGKYANFEEAAFTSLDNYKTDKKGQLYVMTNPAFPSWCKVGMAVDAKDRVKKFQTSSPYRNYELIKSYNVTDRRKAERKAHRILKAKFSNRNEWFVSDCHSIIALLDEHFGVEQFELF